MFSALDFFIWDPLKFRLTLNLAKDDAVLDDGRNKTIVAESFSVYTRNNTDLKQNRIKVGKTVAETMLREMVEKLKKQGVELFVLFIPSKQSSLEPFLVKEGVKLTEAFRKVIENEKQLENGFVQFFKTLGVKTANARKDLQRTIKQTGNVYPFQIDDHPIANGYHSYARTAFEAFLGKQPVLSGK